MAQLEIKSFNDCISDEEKKQRFGVSFINGIVWLILAGMVVASMGVFLLILIPGWILNHLMSEYNVRKLEAVGTAVSPRQLPEVHQAAQEVCSRFGMKTMPRIVVISSGESNAFSLRFARQKVVLILSELLEGIIDNPAQLRFLIAHEACHGALDQGGRGVFEVYKPARYRQAREMTCDNAGLVAAGDLQQAKETLKKLCIGRKLHGRLSEETLVADADRLYSGFIGWLLRQYLTHPPAGSRLRNVAQFQTRVGASSLASPASQPAVMMPPLANDLTALSQPAAPPASDVSQEKSQW